MILEERLEETNIENQQLATFLKPGCCYLKILMYWAEEKAEGEKKNTFNTWESFVRKYYDENGSLVVNIFEGEKLFSKVCKIRINQAQLWIIWHMYTSIFIRVYLIDGYFSLTI